MPDSPADLDIQQLAARAGVTVRTIRYYVQQGLLPSPHARGPVTRYRAGHLDRLRLIRRLQQQHLPLSEIRRRVEKLSDAAVLNALAEAPEKKGRRSAADYIRAVLAADTRPASELATSELATSELETGELATRERATHESAREVSYSDVSESPASYSLASSALLRREVAPLEPETPPLTGGTRSTWERIGLTNDIELHVRRPLSREQNRQLEQLLAVAREVLFAKP